MARGRDGTPPDKGDCSDEDDRKPRSKSREAAESDSIRKRLDSSDVETGEVRGRRKSEKSRRKSHESSEPEESEERKPRKRDRSRRRSRRRYSRESDSDGSSSEASESESESEYSDSETGESESVSESEGERRRKRRERRRREEERERRRRKREKEKKRRRREREEEEERKRKKKKKKKERKKSKEKERAERGKTGAVTNSWGKYGIIRETDMWSKRPEFTAWLAEVKQVNLEHLANWEEKQMFKDFMEDHNTATFPSKKYYNLDAYHRHEMEKEIKKGKKKVQKEERTVFNDEEQRRLELLQERERRKEEEVNALKRSMQGGMAQAMKEQAQLREEMAYQYKLGNFEAAAAIQRRLDPNIAL